MKALAALVFGGAAWAASTTAWEMTTRQDFLRGKFSNVSLTADGRLRVTAPWTAPFEDGQSALWTAVAARDGEVYLGSGHKGRVIRARDKAVIFTAPEPEIFALAVAPDGAIFAGSSPDGKVYRIANGKAAEYFNPESKYIWSLAVGPDGTVYVGTGDQGKIFAVTAPGKGELYWDSGQAHITSLAFEASGALLAGSDPNGILYRVTGRDKAFVVYDASLPEIRAIAPQPDGRVYVAALGGSVAKRTAAVPATNNPGGVVVTAPTTTITVEAQASLDLKPKAEGPKPVVQSAVTPAPQVLDLTGVEKSAIYVVEPDGTVETLWSSKEENAFDVAADDAGLVFSTDGGGRVYRLANRQTTLVEQTNRGEIVRLLRANSRLMAVASAPGALLAESVGAPAAGGTYESPVHDAGSIARWGRLEWHGVGAVKMWTRSGNSARPDKTWSDWSVPLTAPSGIASPNARFAQWKVELAPGAELDSVALAYRPQNNGPAVKSVTVVSQLAATPAAGRSATPTPGGAAYSITVTDSGDFGASSLSGTSTQNAGRPGARQLVIAWTAEDPDADPLSYTLSFRGEDEREWKTLKSNLAETSFTIDGDALADGRYYFRVVATDRTANPVSEAREGELVSAPVRIDNTPPVVTMGREGEDIVVRASDTTGGLRRCEYSIDAGPWMVAEAEDGITDSPTETFRLRLAGFKTGEHLLTVRVTDAAGNPGLAKLVLR
ncbi:MAG: hypothetical protein SFV18_18585 [Bryobacteraceae bacterium]|nr:hypothetical protein [Bryobacteraceae bacterium]